MENDVASDDNFLFSQIPDAVGFTGVRVAHKKTRLTLRVEFGTRVLLSVYIGGTTEYKKVRERGFGIKPRLIRGTIKDTEKSTI
jgi:hypothetical protein